MTEPFAQVHALLELDAESTVRGITRSIGKPVRYELGSGGVSMLALCQGPNGDFGLVDPRFHFFQQC